MLKSSVFLAVLRKIILLIPLIFILPLFIPNQTFAVFLAEPIADTCAVIITASLFYRHINIWINKNRLNLSLFYILILFDSINAAAILKISPGIKGITHIDSASTNELP